MAIGLSDETFRLKDTGVTLNIDSGGLVPFVDITKVSGLDNAPYRETIRDHEGMDGGFMDAEFEKGRDIVLDGVIYANTSNVETFLDSLKANFAPVQSPIPFYYKVSNSIERVVFVKPRGVRYDWETLRRVGVTEAQFLMFAEDPRLYDSTLSSTIVPWGSISGLGFQFVTLLDTFTRTTSSSWGTSDSGHTYTLTGTAADFATNGTTARITLTAATGTAYYALSNLTSTINNYVFAQGVTISATPTGGTISQLFDFHYEDANNYYRAELIWTTSNTVQIALIKVVASTPTTIVAATTVGGLTSASSINVRCESTEGYSTGTRNGVRVKVWAFGTAEPVAFNIDVDDPAFTGNGTVRVGAVRNSGNTNTNPIVSWSQLEADEGFGFNLDFGGGAVPSGANVTNNGNRPTPVQFVITGPIDNPVIFNNTLSKALGFTISLASGDTLTIDTANRTVFLNGTLNRRNTLTAPGWFFLDPGVNNITIGGSNGTGATQLAINFRSAWR